VTTFTQDGILDIGSGEIRGRKAIHDVIAKMPNSRTTENGLRPASARHIISNIVLKIDGNKAVGRAIGSTTATTIRNGARCSTATATTRTSS
jgi:SnoaL-like domain